MGSASGKAVLVETISNCEFEKRVVGGSLSCKSVEVNGEDYTYYAKYKCVPKANEKTAEDVTEAVSLRFGQLILVERIGRGSR